MPSDDYMLVFFTRRELYRGYLIEALMNGRDVVVYIPDEHGLPRRAVWNEAYGTEDEMFAKCRAWIDAQLLKPWEAAL